MRTELRCCRALENIVLAVNDEFKRTMGTAVVRVWKASTASCLRIITVIIPSIVSSKASLVNI